MARFQNLQHMECAVKGFSLIRILSLRGEKLTRAAYDLAFGACDACSNLGPVRFEQCLCIKVFPCRTIKAANVFHNFLHRAERDASLSRVRKFILVQDPVDENTLILVFIIPSLNAFLRTPCRIRLQVYLCYTPTTLGLQKGSDCPVFMNHVILGHA
jgi:hypothetical protein